MKQYLVRIEGFRVYHVRVWAETSAEACQRARKLGFVVGEDNPYITSSAPRITDAEECPHEANTPAWDSATETVKTQAEMAEVCENPNIKPCPFCGSKHVECHQVSPSLPFSVFCLSCSICGPDGDSEQDAIARWNNRAGEAQK